MVTSFGRKKRSLDQAEKGDIVEVQKMHKVLSIVDSKFKIGSETNQKKAKSQIILVNSEKKTKGNKEAHISNKLKLRHLTQKFNFYCFVPETLVTFSGFTLLFQSTFLAIVLLMACRQNKN